MVQQLSDAELEIMKVSNLILGDLLSDEEYEELQGLLVKGKERTGTQALKSSYPCPCPAACWSWFSFWGSNF